MDRLTKKLCQTTVYVGEESKHLIPVELSVGQTREVLQKLCEYEETGLSPDEVVKLKKSADIKVKNQRTKILGIVKPTVLKQRVSRYGLHINGKSIIFRIWHFTISEKLQVWLSTNIKQKCILIIHL